MLYVRAQIKAELVQLYNSLLFKLKDFPGQYDTVTDQQTNGALHAE